MLCETPGRPDRDVSGSRDFSSAPPADPTLYIRAWTSAHQTPCLIVTLDLALVWANEAAREILGAAEPFQDCAGRLAWNDKVQNAAFRAFIAELDGEPKVWVYRPAEGAGLLVRSEALRPDGATPAAAIMLYPADPTARYVWADLEAVFGLTRAESVIVKRIVGGDRADVIADELGVTLETVRTHIRRIYNKLSISSREQLFSLVSPFRVA